MTDSTSQKRPVPHRQYDDEWIEETWGWDTPEHFIETQGKALRPRTLAAVSLASLKPGMRILDIGCGRGEVVLHCGRLGIHATGVDYSAEALDVAEKAKAKHSAGEQQFMRFLREDVKNLRADDLFDRIFMLDLVEHLHDWELKEVLRMCHGLMKHSGAIILHTLPNKWLYDISYKKLLRPLMPWLAADPRSEKEKSIHVNEMSIVHLSSILKQAGFSSRIWLNDLIVEQAKWHRRQPLQDRRGRIYRWLNRPLVGGTYKLLARTPLKLLITNDIFAVAWKGEPPADIALPLCLTERTLLSLRKICGRTEGREGG